MASVNGFVRIRDRKISADGGIIWNGDSTNVNTFYQQVYDFLRPDYPKFYKMDRLSQAGFLAAEALLSTHSIKDYSAGEVAIILANRNGSLDTDLRFAEASKSAPSPALFVYTLPNIVSGEICIRHNLKGENAFFISDAFDPDLLTSYVDQVMLQTSVKACVAGWIDVLEEHHDVLLYLIEKQERGIGLPHTAEQLNLFYN